MSLTRKNINLNTFVALLVTAVIALVFGMNGDIQAKGEVEVDPTAQAQAEEIREEQNEQQEGQVSDQASTDTEVFEYTAQPGDSLTKLVRRSIQIYAQANNVELSEAEMVYMETQIQIELGSRRLDVGETVTVPVSLIEKYVPMTEQLSEAQANAWQGYAESVTFDLPNVEPTVDPVTDSQQDENAVTDNQSESEEETSEDGTQWYWWVIGAVAIVGLWYLLWRRTGDNDS